jgi:hypothetical protein
VADLTQVKVNTPGSCHEDLKRRSIMDLTYFQTMQVLIAIAIVIIAFGVDRFLHRYTSSEH